MPRQSVNYFPLIPLFCALFVACGEDETASPSATGGSINQGGSAGASGGQSGAGGGGAGGGGANPGGSTGKGGAGNTGLGGAGSAGKGGGAGKAGGGGAGAGGSKAAGASGAGNGGAGSGGGGGGGAGGGGTGAAGTNAGSAGVAGASAGSTGAAGAGAGGAGGQTFVPKDCIEAHGWKGCCAGDVLYLGTYQGAPIQATYCGLNGLQCGWSVEAGRYDCTKEATEDPGGTPRACEVEVPVGICQGCSSDADCNGKKCNLDLRECVDCFEDKDCSAGTACLQQNCLLPCSSDAQCAGDFCTDGRCVSCKGPEDCDSADTCDPVSGSCVECLSDSDCPSQTIEKNCPNPWQLCPKKTIHFLCNQQKKCEQTCQEDKNCLGDNVCHPELKKCVSCYKDKNCVDLALGVRCDLVSGVCLPCAQDSDCQDGNNTCQDGLCTFICKQDSECTDPGQPYCSQGGCVACRSSADCKNPSTPFCYESYLCAQCSVDADCLLGGACFGGSCQYPCQQDNDCKDPSKPICAPQGLCRECRQDGDCKDAARPICDGSSSRCVACFNDFHCPEDARCILSGEQSKQCSTDSITCSFSDDSFEEDDTRAQATEIVLPDGSKPVTLAYAMCGGTGKAEVDWTFFNAQQGDSWSFRAEETNDVVAIRAEVYSSAGELIGRSYYDATHQIELSFLPAGKYFLRLTESSSEAKAISYLLRAEKSAGACQSDDQCDDKPDTQIFRSRCEQGACVKQQAPSNVPQGGLCDALSDCAQGLLCAGILTPHAINASARSVCTQACEVDGDCPPGHLCHELLGSQFCLPPCQSDAECGVNPVSTQPTPGKPWRGNTCNAGRCE